MQVARRSGSRLPATRTSQPVLRDRICGKLLAAETGRCITTRTVTGRLLGSPARISQIGCSAPAEPPIAMMSRLGVDTGRIDMASVRFEWWGAALRGRLDGPSRSFRSAALIQISRPIDRHLIQRILSMSARCIVAWLTQRTRTMREAEKLQECAAWYREFAERAGNPSIWESRLRMAADLEREAAQMLR